MISVKPLLHAVLSVQFLFPLIKIAICPCHLFICDSLDVETRWSFIFSPNLLNLFRLRKMSTLYTFLLTFERHDNLSWKNFRKCQIKISAKQIVSLYYLVVFGVFLSAIYHLFLALPLDVTKERRLQCYL